jgi:hypothetical protein
MTVRLGRIAGAAAFGLLAGGPHVLQLRLGTAALAQAADMAGIGRSESVSARATVTSIDQATRTVTLQGAGGNTIALKVSDEVRNLPQVKVGDTVIAHYFTSTAYVLSPPGAKLPDDALTVAGARAAPGDLPAGVLGTKLVVTGLVVGVDPALHTVSLVDPAGGAIRTISVVTPEGQQNLHLVKIGDTITAIISEAVLVGVEAAM